MSEEKKRDLKDTSDAARQLATYLDVHGSNFRAMTELFSVEIKSAPKGFPPDVITCVGEYRYENMILYLKAIPQPPQLSEPVYAVVAFYVADQYREATQKIVSGHVGMLSFWKGVIASTICESSPFVQTEILTEGGWR